MDNPNQDISSRKDDHIRINMEEDVQSGITSGMESIRFEHNALPELDMEEIDTSQSIFGKTLNAPILISSMTGGAEKGKQINAVLASAAAHSQIAMGLGSQRAALERPELQETFQVRRYAPHILLFANLGAVQLNYVSDYVSYCQKAVDMVGADALYLHLNPLQEALQPEGDIHFSGLLKKIEKVVRSISVPVIIKEVGWGIGKNTARQLIEAGVQGIDVAGAGGTSWSQVEMHRLKDPNQKHVAASFVDWGNSTADAIMNVKKGSGKKLLIASGGIRNGVEIAKCIRLGAHLVGLAGPFLKSALVSEEETIKMINELILGLRITMFITGSINLTKLSRAKLINNSRR